MRRQRINYLCSIFIPSDLSGSSFLTAYLTFEPSEEKFMGESGAGDLRMRLPFHFIPTLYLILFLSVNPSPHSAQPFSHLLPLRIHPHPHHNPSPHPRWLSLPHHTRQRCHGPHFGPRTGPSPPKPTTTAHQDTRVTSVATPSWECCATDSNITGC